MKPRTILFFIAIFAAGALAGWLLRGSSLAALKSTVTGKPLASWTWCPRQVTEITALPSLKKFNEPGDLKILCTATVEDDGVDPPGSFTAVYKATDAGGQTSFIEYGGDGVFRADGKVFRSRAFEKVMSSRN